MTEETCCVKVCKAHPTIGEEVHRCGFLCMLRGKSKSHQKVLIKRMRATSCKNTAEEIWKSIYEKKKTKW
jgi:hypothetical protein